MKRREVLVAASLAFTGCLGSAADATGPRTPPTASAGSRGTSTPRPDLYLASFDAKAADDGDVRVVGTVANRSDVRRTGTVEATLTVRGESYTNATTVTVDAGGETSFEVPFDVAYDAFSDQGGVSVRVRS